MIYDNLNIVSYTGDLSVTIDKKYKVWVNSKSLEFSCNCNTFIKYLKKSNNYSCKHLKYTFITFSDVIDNR